MSCDVQDIDFDIHLDTDNCWMIFIITLTTFYVKILNEWSIQAIQELSNYKKKCNVL